jgi:gamma-glutamyltranspeptidase
MDIRQIEAGFCPSPDGKAVEALNGMVATAAPEATEAGVEMLRKGGNAVDAAVAAAIALGGRISLEADRFSPGLIEFLKKKGYRIDIREPFAFYLGCIQAVLKRHTGKGFQGITDVRRPGRAKGT